MTDELPIVHDKDISELGASLSDYRPSWDEYFMLLAKLAATRSTCFSRPVGAVIVLDRRVLTTGYNGSAPGSWHCTDKRECFWRKPENHTPGIEPRELSRAIHAEMNAIAHAARKGIIIEGGSIYCTLSPCMNCFKALVSAGIKKVYFEHIYDFNNQGGDKFLLDYYKQYSPDTEIHHLAITPQTLDTAVKFISGTTSQRRHEHY